MSDKEQELASCDNCAHLEVIIYPQELRNEDVGMDIKTYIQEERTERICHRRPKPFHPEEGWWCGEWADRKYRRKVVEKATGGLK